MADLLCLHNQACHSYLTGKPVGLALGKPKEYEAQAMYIMGGIHCHTDAVSHSSAEDCAEGTNHDV